MRRLLVNDALNQLGEHTFWNDLMEWFDMQFVPIPFDKNWGNKVILPQVYGETPSLIVRNSSYLPPLALSSDGKTDKNIPTISLLQDIISDGPQREMQETVIRLSLAVVYNSSFTASKYADAAINRVGHPLRFKRVIPLPVDFTIFTPQNAMGCQQELGLPDGCVCWIGASQGAAGQVKGYDIFMSLVRQNPDISFVAVFKDAAPETVPPNLRCYVRLPHAELVKVIGACLVGLCTSRTESQHLAGIEMGACGLPMIAPPVGVYWKREGLIGAIVEDPTPERYALAIRTVFRQGIPADTDFIRSHWIKEFDRVIIKLAWTKLISEVEHVRV